MRGDRNFKGSDSSDTSVYFLFCGINGAEISMPILEFLFSASNFFFNFFQYWHSDVGLKLNYNAFNLNLNFRFYHWNLKKN